jgi:hypothetical protein
VLGLVDTPLYGVGAILGLVGIISQGMAMLCSTGESSSIAGKYAVLRLPRYGRRALSTRTRFCKCKDPSNSVH